MAAGTAHRADRARAAPRVNARPDLASLTGARGIAAWLVVLYHIRLSIDGLPDSVEGALSRGYLAVDFFFLLSGFVIWLAYHERFRTLGLSAAPDFLRRRVARIWPLHAFLLLCAVLLAGLLLATGRPAPHYPFAELPLHLLLVQNWGFTDALTWNDPAWSISVEAFAYLLFVPLVLAVDWRRVPAPAILAAMAALFVLLAATMAAGGADDLGDQVPRFGLLRGAIGFAAGTMVAALWERWHGNRVALVASIAALAVAGIVLASGASELIAVPPLFAALLMSLALVDGVRGNPLAMRLPVWLGEISYATYLGHFLLWQAFKLAFVADPMAVPPSLIALYLALVLASSAILYRSIERPAQRWMNAPRRPARSGVLA